MLQQVPDLGEGKGADKVISDIHLCGVAFDTVAYPPAILVEKDADCDECGTVHDIEVCPLCKSYIQLGYGLMFGGMGAFSFCLNDDCNWYVMDYDDEDDE